MKNVRNDGTGPLLAFGREIDAGATVEMPDEQAAQLAGDPHVEVTVTAKRSPRPTKARGNPTVLPEKE